MIPALLTRFVRPFALGPGRVAATGTTAHPHGHVGSGGFPSCYVLLYYVRCSTSRVILVEEVKPPM